MLLKQKDAIIISGKITSGPELKETRTGRTVATFSLRYDYDKEAGTGRFIHVSVWGDDGTECEKMYHKGDSLFVVGRLSQYEYDGKEYQSVNADIVVPGTGVIAAVSSPAGHRQETT